MLDIVAAEDGKDLRVANSVAPKAGNVIAIQLGSLTYAPEFGADLAYFLSEDTQFQTKSFESYLVQRLTEHQINVAEVFTSIETFLQRLSFSVGDAAPNAKGLIV